MESIVILSVIAAAALAYFLWGKGAAEKTALRERLEASESALEILNEELETKRKYIKQLEVFIVEQADAPTVASMLNRLFAEDGGSGDSLSDAGASEDAAD